MRQTSLFNNDWKFFLGDASGAETTAFDDRDWRPVTLPHDWSVEQAFDPQFASATGFLPGGVGWYRKTFTLPDVQEPQCVFLHFDGVYCNSEVWINGHFLGKRPSGFASFRYELTPFLHLDRENTVTVKADHTKYADSRWYTGSGIYRDVTLLVTDPVHLKQWGVFVTIPAASSETAEVCIEATLQNQSGAAANVQVALILRDPEGQVAAEASVPAPLLFGGEQVVSSTLTVTQPRLWSVDAPTLYTLHTEVRRDGAAIDGEETAVGIRTFHFDPDSGFFLNGHNMKLKGVCLHDDAGVLGVAVPPKVWERRLRTLKSGGTNAIRMSHNPHLPALYDLCDRLGLLVQDEAFDEWEIGKRKWIEGWNFGPSGTDGPHEFFEEWSEADLRDMILRGRNHPSIIMWSIGNEIDYPNDPYSHEILDSGKNPQIYGRGFQPEYPHADRIGVVARRLVAIAKTHDTTRPVTAGLAGVVVSNEVGFAEALDAVGYNYQEYRYADDHTKYPNRVLYGSENGMRWDFWAAVADNPYVSGQFLWTGIDYLGEARRWPAHGSGAGLLDLAGLPKPEYYFRRSLWTSEPMIYLGVSPVPDGSESDSLWSHKQAEPVWNGVSVQTQRVSGFTNCAQVELFLNGQSLGVKTPETDGGHVVWWDIPYAPGTLTLNALDNSGGIIASDTLRTAGSAKTLQIESDTASLAADGLDLAHLLVSVVDENGTTVDDAASEVTWTVTGPAKLLGLENGDLTAQNYGGNTRPVYHGHLLGYLQSTQEAGPVTVTVASPGLETATLILRSS